MTDEQTDEPIIDLATRVATVEAILLEHPSARVVAIDAHGLSVPMPGTVPLRRHRILDGRAIIDHVAPEDMTATVRAWYKTMNTGASATTVRLTSNPERWFKLHMIDTRETYGVIMGIVVPEYVGEERAVADDVEVDNGQPRYATLRMDNMAIVTECDEAYTRIFGWTSEEIAGIAIVEHVHPDDQARAIEGWMTMLATRHPHHMRTRYRRKDGTYIWLDTTLHNFLGHVDRDYVLGELIDVSVEMEAQEALAAREQLLDRLAQALPVGLFQVEVDGRVIYSNERLHEILGVPATEDLAELLQPVAEEDRPTLEEALAAVLNDDGDADIEIDLCLAATGERRRCLVSSRALNGPNGAVTGAIVCVSDITDSARMRVELEERALELDIKATFDMLTGCYNRGSTMAALDQALIRQGQSQTGAVFVDLDNFKPVNDLLGHAAGDELLIAVAERLRSAMRGDDIVGRIGGDEFLVICHHVDGPSDALVVARRIADCLTQEITLAAGTIDLSASIGVACSEPGMTADALVARADEAMYHSKRDGKGLPVLHHPTLTMLADDNGDKGPHKRSTRRVARPHSDPVLAGSGTAHQQQEACVLMGVAEVASYLAVSEDRVSELALRNSTFPKPLATVSGAPLWSPAQIAAFAVECAPSNITPALPSH